MVDHQPGQPQRRRMAGIPPLASGGEPVEPAAGPSESSAEAAAPLAEPVVHPEPAVPPAADEPPRSVEPVQNEQAQSEPARPTVSQPSARAAESSARARRRMGGPSSAPRAAEIAAEPADGRPRSTAGPPAAADAAATGEVAAEESAQAGEPESAASAPAEQAPESAATADREAAPATETAGGSGRRRMAGASNAPLKATPSPSAPSPSTPTPRAPAARPAVETEATQTAAEAAADQPEEQTDQPTPPAETQQASPAPASRRRRMSAGPAAAAADESAQPPEPESAPAARRRRMGAADPAGDAAETDPEPQPSAAEPSPSTAAPAAQPESEQPESVQPAEEHTDSPKPAAAQQPLVSKAAGAAPAGPKSPRKPARQPMSTAKKSVFAVVGVVVVGLVVVLAARWLRTLTGVEAFIDDYSGHATQPEAAPVGFPGWLGWHHFFNMFLLVLIVRTGLQVRLERRPPGYWTPKQDSFFSPGKQKPTKVSMSQWLHQSLDVLWVVNGLIFAVLLFTTGHWMRIVPTSWDIFPNALSAALQYASLDWPLAQSWVHYNALQVIAYFTTVFIAAPLAIITGLRLSTWWPKDKQSLSRIYPVEAARALHFPVMIYFVAFTVVHVFLVFFTGALRNLNYMYTSRDAVDFWGLVIFLISLVVIAAGWLLTSQMFVRPIANTMGSVTKR